MLTRRSLICSTLALVLCAAGSSGYAQRSAETTAEVPALDSFHEVIFKIWHEAWPEKNTAMLRQLLPEVEKGIASVASAQLPGILREKKTAWEEGVKKLQMTGSEYRAAVEANKDSALLASAEKLHSQFEALMRITRPALKELDEFHAVLYMLFHHYLPDYDLEKIRASVGELKQRMAALNASQLPERLKQKESQFQAARARLSQSVDALEPALRSNNEKTIREAVSVVHADYQALNGVFE
jgi:NADH dehydrogenase/NADH:ubiquinone oxidoreductase subunit G